MADREGAGGGQSSANPGHIGGGERGGFRVGRGGGERVSGAMGAAAGGGVADHRHHTQRQCRHQLRRYQCCSVVLCKRFLSRIVTVAKFMTPNLMQKVFLRFSILLLLWGGLRPVCAQNILLSDFEEANYAWLPGGIWTTNGNCFGSGPAQGTLTGQQTVDGFLGNGLVNTFLGGDAGTGTLVSPLFTIQRNYISFLIGGGSYRGEGGYGGETRIDLLVDGQLVQDAAGPGEWEHLDWEQWNVSNLLGQTAQIRIVDTATGGWGHLNVDQIVESDSSMTTGVILPT